MRIVKRYKVRADIPALALFASAARADISASDTKRVKADIKRVWPGFFRVIGRCRMARVTHTRNPYPVPDVSREGVWIQGPVLGDKVSPGDKDWGIKLKAHERLFAHHTLNSVRKDKRLMRSKVPNDALDLALTTVYVHSKDTLVPKTYVPMQPETLGRETWRVLRNEIKIRPKSSEPSTRGGEFDYMHDGRESADPLASLIEKSECYRGPVVQRRIHPSSVKLNIDGPHTVQSNPGYSRKIDGTFYSI